MKYIYVILLFASVLMNVNYLNAQTYGDEWIDYNQKYFTLKVYQTGIHRVEFSELSSALQSKGIDVSTIPTSGFQIFGREKEVALYMNDGGDGVFDAGDYFEFFAEKNDGWLDALMFDNPASVGDTYYSFFNDTIHYFFTWNNGGGAKRMQVETDVNFSAYPQVDYCWKKSYIKYTDSYGQGKKFQGLSSPVYTAGEGWMSGLLAKNQTLPIDVGTSNIYMLNSGLQAKIEAVSASASSSSYTGSFNHNTKIYLNNVLKFDTSYMGYEMIKKSFWVGLGELSSPFTTIKYHISNIGQLTDYQRISSVTIDYPRTLDFGNATLFAFGLPSNSIMGKYHVSVSNSSVVHPFLYADDGVNIFKIPTVLNGGEWKAVIPNTTNDSLSCYWIDSASFTVVNGIEAVTSNAMFTDYSQNTDANPYVIITHSSLMNGARNYASYRATTGYDTLVIDVRELYYQFGGGIDKHSLAIKRFLHKAYDSWQNKPAHLFLIGKSVREVNEASLGARNDVFAYNRNLVPSYGYPPSDNHFSVGLDANTPGFVIPTGRLSVTQNHQVEEYLNKVMEYEQQQTPFLNYTIADKEWQKNVLLFGGGTDSIEQSQLNYYLENFKEIIEDTLFGGMVDSYLKDPTISVINTQDFFEVQQKLSEGVSLITFLGHASNGGGFSQNIDSPNNWNNNGKYPFVIGLGCYTGDVHQPDTTSYAEQLIQPVNEGAIAFMSTVKLGFVSYISNYTTFMYKEMGKYHYGETIGEQMYYTVDTLAQMIGFSGWDVIQESNFNGMSLQGDPALRLNTHQAPEIVLAEDRVWSVPTQIDLSVDTFDLYVVVTNIGRAFRDSFSLEVKRIFPNGSDSTYTKIVSGLLNRDTIVFRMPTYHNIAVGANQYIIKADLPNSVIAEHVDEYNNNQINYTNYVISNGLLPIWPYDYAIIPNQQETLKASTINPFAPERTYVFEIDTTDLFNSSFKKVQRRVSGGGVVEALPTHWINSTTNLPEILSFTDSTVYFWRCSPDSTVKTWVESSFQYIPEKWGWGQSHFFQFKNNAYTNIDYNRTSRTFDFHPSVAQLDVVTKIHLNTHWTSPEPQATLWKISGATQDYGGFVWPAIHIGIVDPISLTSWRTPWVDGNGNVLNADHCFGQFNGDPSVCGNTTLMGRNRTQGIFIFNFNSPEQMDSLASLLTNKIPDGHYIVAYTYIPNTYTSPMSLNSAMPPALFLAFQNLGFTGLVPGDDDKGFILFCKKGVPSSAQEVYSLPMSGGVTYPAVESLEFQAIIQGSNTQGFVNSTIAGPARDWKTLYWKQHAGEANTGDTTRLRLSGITDNGYETVLLDTLMTTFDSVLQLENIIDANQYPRARLQAWEIDSSTFTPAQLERWQLIYSPVPECAVNPQKGYYYSVTNDTISEGDSVHFAIAIENVSAFDMDSLKVDYWIEDQGHTRHYINYPRQDSLRTGVSESKVTSVGN